MALRAMCKYSTLLTSRAFCKRYGIHLRASNQSAEGGIPLNVGNWVRIIYFLQTLKVKDCTHVGSVIS